MQTLIDHSIRYAATLSAIFDKAGVRFEDEHGERVAAEIVLHQDATLPALARDAARLSAALNLTPPEVEIIPSPDGLFGEVVRFAVPQAGATLLLVEAARLRFGLPENRKQWSNAKVKLLELNFDKELVFSR